MYSSYGPYYVICLMIDFITSNGSLPFLSLLTVSYAWDTVICVCNIHQWIKNAETEPENYVHLLLFH